MITSNNGYLSSDYDPFDPFNEPSSLAPDQAISLDPFANPSVNDVVLDPFSQTDQNQNTDSNYKLDNSLNLSKKYIKIISAHSIQALEKDSNNIENLQLEIIDIQENPEKAAWALHKEALVVLRPINDGKTEVKVSSRWADLINNQKIKKITLHDINGQVKQSWEEDSFQIQSFKPEEIHILSIQTFIAVNHIYQERKKKEDELKKKEEIEENFKKEQVLKEILLKERIKKQESPDFDQSHIPLNNNKKQNNVTNSVWAKIKTQQEHNNAMHRKEEKEETELEKSLDKKVEIIKQETIKFENRKNTLNE